MSGTEKIDPNDENLNELVATINELARAEFPEGQELDECAFENLIERAVVSMWAKLTANDPELHPSIDREINQYTARHDAQNSTERSYLEPLVSQSKMTLGIAKYVNRLATDAIHMSDAIPTLSIIPDSPHIGGCVLHQLLLIGTHARLIAICDDIVWLCEAGRIDSAKARARTACEVVIVQAALAAQEPGSFELSERYYVWSQCEAGDFTEDELKEKVVANLGPGFFRNLAWAAPLLNKSKNPQIGLQELATALKLEKIYAHYRQFNHEIHAGPSKLISESNFNTAYPFPIELHVSARSCAHIIHVTLSLLRFSCGMSIRALAIATGDYRNLPYLGMLYEISDTAISTAIQTKEFAASKSETHQNSSSPNPR